MVYRERRNMREKYVITHKKVDIKWASFDNLCARTRNLAKHSK